MWSKKTIQKSLLHLLLWIAVWFFFYYFFSYNSNDQLYIVWFSSLLLPLTAGVTYFMVYFLIPRYLLKKRYFLFGLYGFYTLVLVSYIIVLEIYSCLIFLLSFNVSVMPPMSKNFFFILILVFLIAGIVSFVSLLNTNFKIDSKNKELENKILETQLQLKDQELVYLKRQIHPHFLFNTLNTIYGLALKKSDDTTDVILKLSNLLDYILYQVSKPMVSLNDEVHHIREYVELEKIRFQDSLKVTFKASDIDEHIQIAPMLLIPFVENAFKHGSLINGFLNIDIDVAVVSDRLEFSISNSFKKDEEQQASKQGIGLRNIMQRLELHYGSGFEIEQKEEKEQFVAKLVVFDLKKMKNVE